MINFFIGLLLGLTIGVLIHFILKRSQTDQKNEMATLFEQ